jgi:hypothetical protein
VSEGVERGLRKTWEAGQGLCLTPNTNCLGKERANDTDAVGRTEKIGVKGEMAHTKCASEIQGTYSKHKTCQQGSEPSSRRDEIEQTV